MNFCNTPADKKDNTAIIPPHLTWSRDVCKIPSLSNKIDNWLMNNINNNNKIGPRDFTCEETINQSYASCLYL